MSRLFEDELFFKELNRFEPSSAFGLCGLDFSGSESSVSEYRVESVSFELSHCKVAAVISSIHEVRVSESSAEK